jgi:ubiquinol oxidase
VVWPISSAVHCAGQLVGMSGPKGPSPSQMAKTLRRNAKYVSHLAADDMGWLFASRLRCASERLVGPGVAQRPCIQMESSLENTTAIALNRHHQPVDMSDRFALACTKALRFCADTFFAKRYGHRAIVLETVAAVPGMVGATINHLRCLRRMCDDRGWIRTLMEEAENERMHLMTFIEIAQPTMFERFVVMAVQWVFYVGFFLLYLVSAKTAHRLVGYFEEEAVISYTHYLREIDEGRSANVQAPPIARHYWKLNSDATLRDVVLLVRADEAHHRDVNHGFAMDLAGKGSTIVERAPYPVHAQTLSIPTAAAD